MIYTVPSIRAREWSDWHHMLVIFSFIFGIYFWSAPRTVVLEDDGIFILAAYFNGIAHPPGYPLYTLLAHLFSYVPIANVAFKLHLFSAFTGSCACAILWIIVRKLLHLRTLAYLAGLGLGLSTVFWSQSIIAEVYTLNALIFFILCLLCINCSYKTGADKNKLLLWISFVYGLGLTNHWPLLVLSTPLLISLLWPVRDLLVRRTGINIFFLVLGLFPYLWLVIRSQMNPEISFYGPIDSWEQFWFTVTREGYKTVDINPGAGWSDRLQFIRFIGKELVVQYGIIGFLFMLIGVSTQWRKLPLNICIGLIACFLCNTVVLVGLLKFDFDLVHQNIFRVYPVIAYAVVAIWIATGVHSCVQLLNSTKYSVPGPEVMRVLLTVLVIGTSLLSNIPKNYRAKDSLAHDYALGILESLEKGAIFFTFADNTVGPMAYLNKIEGVRPDITLYNSQGLVYSNRLYRFSAASEEKKEKLDKLISTSQRPVYYMGELDHQYANYHMGLYLRVDKTSTEKTTVYQYNEQILNSFLSLIAKGEPVDPWESMMYKLLVSDYCRLSAIYAKEGIQADEEIDSWYDENCRTYLGYLEYTEVMLEDEEPDWSRIKALLDLADVLSYEAIAKEDSSRVQYYRGLMYSALNELELAVESHNRSLQLWSHPKNPSNSKLRELMSNRESG